MGVFSLHQATGGRRDKKEGDLSLSTEPREPRLAAALPLGEEPDAPGDPIGAVSSASRRHGISDIGRALAHDRPACRSCWRAVGACLLVLRGVAYSLN